MPLGAARLTLLAFQPTVAVEAEVIRKKIGVSALGNAQVDTAQYKFGGASAYFDGTTDFLQANIAMGSEDFTLEFWWRPTSRVGSFPAMVGSMGSSFNANGEWAFYDRHNSGNTKFRFYWREGAVFYFLESTTTVSNGTWYHLAVSRSGSTIKLFVDGTEEDSDTTSQSFDTGQDIIIGAENTGGTNASNGHIDELRVSNTARYTASFTAPTAPFVNDDDTQLLLHMNGTDGSTFFEDDNGVGRSAVGVIANGNAQIDTAESKFGGASALFDGTGDYLAMNVPSSYDDDFTIEGWVRLDVLPSSTQFRMLFAGNSNTEYASIYNASGTYLTNLVIRNSGGSYYETYYEIPSISTNTWYHIAWVKSGTSIKHFFDGTELTILNSSTGTMGSDYGFDGYHYLARWNGNTSHMLDGYMDEVRISNTARYTTGFTPSTTPFVNDSNTLLLLHMDGTDADTDFSDDNGDHTTGRTAVLVSAENDAQVDTAQSKFGGSSALFDGTQDYLEFSGSQFAYGTDDFTIETWVRFDIVNKQQHIFDARTTQNQATPLIYLTSAGKLNYYVNGSNRITGTTVLSTNTWYHVALSRNSGTTKLFIDGTQEGSDYSDSVSYIEGAPKIGFYYDTANVGLDGYVDEFRISDSARYTSAFTAPTAPFVDDANTLLLLHMDGADGSTSFVDDVGGRSSVGVSASGNAQIDTADSKFGGSSALFDGTGDYLTLPNQTFTGDFTIEFFAKPDAATSLQVALRMGHWTGSTWQNDAVFQFRGSTAPSNTSRWYVIFNDGTLGLSVASGGGGVWSHIAVCRSGGTTRLFKDGALVDSVTVGSPSQIGGNASTDNITIGAVESGGLTQDFDGWIDEVRISNTARYTAAFTAPTEPFKNDANTLLLLHMDGTDGSTVFIDDNGKQST